MGKITVVHEAVVSAVRSAVRSLADRHPDAGLIDLVDAAKKQVFVDVLCTARDWGEAAAQVRTLRLGNCGDPIEDPRAEARAWGPTYASASRRLVRQHS